MLQKDYGKKNLETALERLERITTELEEGDLSLENSLKKFDEGIGLIKFCNSKLEEARTRVDLLLKQDGSLTSVDFNEDERGDQTLS